MNPFLSLTPEQARAYVVLTQTQRDAQAFFEGEHFDVKFYPEMKGWDREVQQAFGDIFTQTNKCQEVVMRAVRGVLAEPLTITVGLADEDSETGEQATAAQAERDVPARLEEAQREAERILSQMRRHNTFDALVEQAAAQALVVERANVRLFIPYAFTVDREVEVRDDAGRALLTPDGEIEVRTERVAPQGQVEDEDAWRVVRMAEAKPETATVYTHPDTCEQLGVFLYTAEETARKHGQDDDYVEVTYIDREVVPLPTDDTLIVQYRGHGEHTATLAYPVPLGGLLPMIQLEHPTLLTNSVLSLQKAINFALTMLYRNVSRGGHKTRILAGLLPPSKTVVVNGEEVEVYDDLPEGGGATMIADVATLPDSDGTLRPVSHNVYDLKAEDPKIFIDAIRMLYWLLLAEVDQLHILIQDEASPSGVSRREARNEFLLSLNRLTGELETKFSDLLTAALRMVAWVMGDPRRFDGLRVQATCQPDPARREQQRDEQRDELDLKKLRLEAVEQADQVFSVLETALVEGGGYSEADAERLAQEARAGLTGFTRGSLADSPSATEPSGDGAVPEAEPAT